MKRREWIGRWWTEKRLVKKGHLKGPKGYKVSLEWHVLKGERNSCIPLRSSDDCNSVCSTKKLPVFSLMHYTLKTAAPIHLKNGSSNFDVAYFFQKFINRHAWQNYFMKVNDKNIISFSLSRYRWLLTSRVCSIGFSNGIFFLGTVHVQILLPFQDFTAEFYNSVIVLHCFELHIEYWHFYISTE